MRLIDPRTGRAHLRKRRVRYDEEYQPRELTFSCFKRYPFFSSERTCQWFVDAMKEGRAKFGIEIWAYVIMPEHVHVLVYPAERPKMVKKFLQYVKGSVGRRAINYVRQHHPAWLKKLRVQEGEVIRHRFWQPGGGYDRNVTDVAALRAKIEYVHANPIRRGLAQDALAWIWSSARWYAGWKDVKLAMDPLVLQELAGESVRRC